MAIQRITGPMLESNLVRNGFDLAFETDLLYLDVINGRIGVKTDAPGNFALDVNGNSRIQGNQTITGDLTVQGTTTTIDSQNLVVEDNVITLNENASSATDAGIMINRTSANNALFIWDETLDKFRFGTTTQDGSTVTDYSNLTLSNIQVATPTANDDAATKAYVDSQISSGGVTGDNIELRLPTDSTFGDGAYLGLTSSTKVTNAIDELNEVLGNVQAGTYIKSTSFVADSTAISAGDTVTLTITNTPTAGANTRYTITWGDGDTTTGTSDSTPSHTYASGGTYSVTVKAFENDADTTDSAGSFATSTRTDYIVASTAEPVLTFAMYAAASGGSAITTADTGDTVYLQNNCTNTSGATVTYDVDWGDGTEDTISGDGVAGGSSANGGSRLAHTYTNAAGDDGSTVAGTGSGDTKYAIRLRLLTHSTANPSVIPKTATNNFEVYSEHTPLYSTADSTIRGVNEESTSGFPVTFTNNTATNPGANSSFSATQTYSWDFGEGASATTVNIGSGGSGDTGNTIANTFNLTSGQQSGGTTRTFTTSLTLANGHTNSTFSSNLNIIVEPDVRANIAGTAVTVNTGSGDNSLSLYDVVDLDGADRAIARFTNTSQNADNYEYDFFDDSSSIVTVGEDGSTAGTIGATIDKDYSGTSVGNINFRFRASGTPDTIAQDDEETITFVMKSTPSAPNGLSSFSLALSDSAQGTHPKLCASFDDNSSSFSSQSAGDSLATTTARRYVDTTTIDTTVINGFLVNDANGTGSTVNQTVTASINTSASGARTFTTTEGGANNGTFTKLVTSDHKDYDTVNSAYPQRLYLVADAKITQDLADYTVGSNAQRLESSAGGDTNLVYVVKDDITTAPTTTIGTVAEGTQGTYQYVSGVPYYSGTGSPTVTVTGTTIANLTGQAFRDETQGATHRPHEIDAGTNQESTSGNALASNPDRRTFANIDGSSTMLDSGIPIADTGVSSAYTIGVQTLSLNSSARTVQTIKARSRNCNGDGGYSETSTKIQVYSSSLLTLDNEAGGITVSDSLGAGHDDDAVRIAGFGSLSSDTPSLFDSSNANYYTDSAWSGAVTVAGTNEAIARFGTIKHFTTDLSSGYLPVGPDLATDRSGAQYYTFAFRRTTMSNFTVRLSGTVSGVFIAAPGTAIDSASSLNGWLDASTTYGGSGVPGANTGSGGNGSNGCAFTSGDRILDGTSYSNSTFTLTLGSENATNATGNNVLVRIKLESGDSITALSIE
jgi:plastocyanin